jgi:hypothetical protein
VPTLVLHRKNAPFFVSDQGRHLAGHIPGARFVSVPGTDLSMDLKPNAQILGQIEAFISDTEPSPAADRALAAILFTDIVARPGVPPRLGTVAGATSWRAMTLLPVRSLSRTGVAWSS